MDRVSLLIGTERSEGDTRKWGERTFRVNPYSV